MKDLLFEKIINDINSIIAENLSIANELSNSAKYTVNKIKENITNTRAELVNVKGLTFKKNNVFVNVLGRVIRIGYYYYNFMTEKLKNQYIGKINQYNTAFEDEMEITIISVAGNIDIDTLEDTIYHELEHIFQMAKSGKELVTDENDIYNYAVELRHKLPAYSYGYMIATCFYLSKRFEQDAYVNGMYGAVMARVENYEDINKEFKNTQAYGALRTFEDYVNIMKNDEEGVIKAINNHFDKYCLHYGKMMDYFEDRLYRFKTKIGKVFIKIREDFKEQNKDRVKLAPKIQFI